MQSFYDSTTIALYRTRKGSATTCSNWSGQAVAELFERGGREGESNSFLVRHKNQFESRWSLVIFHAVQHRKIPGLLDEGEKNIKKAFLSTGLGDIGNGDS